MLFSIAFRIGIMMETQLYRALLLSETIALKLLPHECPKSDWKIVGGGKGVGG